VSKSELTEFFNTGLSIANPSMPANEVAQEASMIADAIVKEVDLSGDGQISLGEVMAATKKDGKYRKLFLAFSKGMANRMSN
jgi:hypothetical protein